MMGVLSQHPLFSGHLLKVMAIDSPALLLKPSGFSRVMAKSVKVKG